MTECARNPPQPRCLTDPMGACCHASAILPTSEPVGDSFPELPPHWGRFALAIVVAGLSMQFSLGVNLSPVTGSARLWIHGSLALAALVVLALLGGPIFQRSWAAAGAGRITLEQLFLLGIAGALGASLYSSFTGIGAVYYEVVGVLVAVYTFGQLLVERQRRMVNTSLLQLTASLHTAVQLTCCGQRRSVSVSELGAGDRVFVAKGHQIPVDGIIAEGSAYVQEIGHTGEPFPVVKSTGDSVLAGSVALDGDLIVVVGNSPGGRELERLNRRLAEALGQGSQWQHEADRWMAWFVPIVLSIAAGTFTFWFWRADWAQALFNFLAVLLVACPCGLGLGVPIALSSAVRRIALLGIVPTSAELIERLARVKKVIFDKTGTLTEEEIQLECLIGLDPASLVTLSSRLAHVESYCDHPMARPFSALPRQPFQTVDELLSIHTLPGIGIVARLQPKAGSVIELRIGNRRLLRPEHGPALDELNRRVSKRARPNREVFILENGRLVALALLAEKPRPAAAALVPTLHALGLKVGIMTGDTNLHETRWIETGLDIRSGLSTAAKASAVRAMEAANELVLFVGDGLNDSEAMASATASLALHSGDATARAVAHGELSGTSLGVLPEAISLARAARRQLRVILGVSLAYNGLGLLLAAAGWLHPIAAAAVMFASSLTVVTLAGFVPGNRINFTEI